MFRLNIIEEKKKKGFNDNYINAVALGEIILNKCRLTYCFNE